MSPRPSRRRARHGGRGSQTCVVRSNLAKSSWLERSESRTSRGSGASRARTGDLHAASVALSQLSYGPEAASVAESGGSDLDARDVAPQLLEPVERPRLGREDVQDHVEVVRDDPRAF